MLATKTPGEKEKKDKATLIFIFPDIHRVVSPYAKISFSGNVVHVSSKEAF